jgi:alpha-glucosidase (family GH31 glycosyl hydrolase)
MVEVRFLTPRSLEITVLPTRGDGLEALGAVFDSPRDELIYGLTERVRDSEPLFPGQGLEAGVDEIRPIETGSLNRRGETVQMRVRPTTAVYGPFYHSSRGYGLLVGGTTLGEFDLAATEPEQIGMRFETGAAPESRRLRLYLFYGPDHPTILDEYTGLTGRPFVPPDWAFRHWLWRGELEIGEPALLDGVLMNAQLVEDITMYERFGIPAGVYLFDRPVLEGEFGFGRFAWDEERLPNVDAMLAALRDRGYRLATWSAMWACGSGPLDNGPEAQRLGFIAPGPDPSATPSCGDIVNANFILDVTHPEVADWWAAKVSDFVGAYGIQAIKLDRGEEHIPSTASDIWADGRTGVEVRNLYPIVQAEIHRDALHRSFGDDSVVITRSAYTGTQRAAIVWGGDTAGSENYGFGSGTDLGLRGAIINQLRSAFLGYPIWGSDTGGYYQFKHRDVFARWLEFSAFSGIMEIGGVGPQTPWNMPTEPRFDDEMIEIYRRYTSLRETLLDYIAAAAREAGASGMPIARPMIFAFPDDERVLDMWDQYMFGPDLMIAPLWRVGDRSREVYFPAGRWTSYWDESISVEGPLAMTVQAPLDTIPVYVRDGASVAPPGLQ